jgi:hypothetical protein
MDFDLEQRYQRVLETLKEDLGEKPEITAVIFLIGVQELGKGYGKFTKQQKVDLMHIGICTILEPYGFYKLLGKDEEGWPHFESIKKLPPIDGRQQEHLLKQAIVDYFDY